MDVRMAMAREGCKRDEESCNDDDDLVARHNIRLISNLR